MTTFFKKPSVRVAGVIAIVGAIAVGWWLLSPLFITDEVNEAFPMAAAAEIPDDMTIEEVEAEFVVAAETPDLEMEEPMPPDEPVALVTASFVGADSFHEGSGDATIYELADGSRVLRFENFDVTNGPDLHVLLATGTGGELGEYVDLGSLKGNVGSQNYDLPADIDPADYASIVIYCEPFHVVFATADFSG